MRVNKRTQELILSDPHPAPNSKEKKQTNTIKQLQNEQIASRIGNSFTKRWELCYPNLAKYIISPYIIIVQVIFLFPLGLLARPGYFGNRIPQAGAGGGGRGWGGEVGGVCSIANYSVVAYEETQSNRVFDFRDFVCSLFPKANLSDFYFR